MKKTIIVAGTLAALTLTASVQANQDVSGFYLGGGVGKSTMKIQKVKSKADATSLKIIGGYQFNRIVAIETQYTRYGKMTPVKSDSSVKVSPQAFSVAANVGYTFHNGLRPFAILGLSEVTLGEKNNSADDAMKKHATAVRWGAGVAYTPASLSNVSFRLGYEADYFKIKSKVGGVKAKTNIGSAYLAATYKF